MRSTVRILLILAFVASLAAPALAVRRINVRQLDQVLADSKTDPDETVARTLSGLELTQRLSAQNLARIRVSMPGPQSQRALAAVADASAFLNLPAEEIPHNAPLDKDAQQKLLASANDYVDKTLAKLPNFFATESITLFEDNPPGFENGIKISYQPIHYKSRRNATVLYRAGKEVMETVAGPVTENDQLVTAASGLLSSGEFGPVLRTVLTDSQKGKLAFSHWETSPHWQPASDPDSSVSPLAVFRYSVPRKDSHYRIKVELAGESKPRQSRPGYHGEIALDPSTGTILRLTLRADTTDDDSLSAADMMVEYGSVEIGTHSYICPIRSAAVVHTAGPLQLPASTGEIANSAGSPAYIDHLANEAKSQTLLNDVAFEHYHLLHSDAKMLTPADLNDNGSTP